MCKGMVGNGRHKYCAYILCPCTCSIVPMGCTLVKQALQVHSPIHLIHLVSLQIDPCCLTGEWSMQHGDGLVQGCSRGGSTHHWASYTAGLDCVPTDRRVSLQLVQGYLQYSSMCEEHEHQAGCAGFQTGGCAEVFTWFFLIWGMLELCSVMLLHIFSLQNFHFPESHLLLCSFIFFMYVSPIH